jgi:signal transduction histidine kinase
VEIAAAAAAGVAAFVLTALVCAAARSQVPAVVLGLLLLLAVLVVARLAGILYALPVGVATVLAFDWYFLPPLRDLDTATELVLGLFLAMSVIVGALATTASRRAIASEHARGAIAEEQSALRRVATLVAQAGPPSVVFEAVTREVGLLCSADVARMERYEADGIVTGVAAWSRAPSQFAELAVGTRFTLDGLSIARGVQQTGGPVRVDGFGTDTGEIAREARAVGVRSSVGCPIVVGGRLWGVIAASRRIEEPFPADTEAQIARFTELVATAVANVQAREELRALADEQAALRRVATLVAGTAPPAAVFAAVAEEAGRLLAGDLAHTFRYEPDDTVSVVAGWSRQSDHLAVGSRYPLHPSMVTALVRRTGQPARTDTYSPSSPLADEARRLGVRSTVGCPITVEGRLWGLVGVSSSRPEPLPANTEARLTDFAELAATAIANAEARAALTASRARIVATTDQVRRRIERDLHDGAQQRLVSVALRLRTAAAAIPLAEEVQQELVGIGSELDDALDDLRELSRGIHPAILSEGGLGPALRTLARRSSVPVELQVGTKGRLPERVEVAAYFVVAEALANVAKHAGASVVQVDVDADDGLLRLAIGDDGVGGADPARGSGLVGLKDRVEATGGTLRVESRRGQGTRLLVELPADASQPTSLT